ncbi:hypothetical protein CK503_15715 [Aliifodinibius salipaludis]|uniref:Uncharacterized protein n=1 Tax=Fodinibius salipaludis TaxID=2032627 RepID=A0A2A2G735_9BACT|nr:hypothetical protein [Aliifodinibius salipaludis]PAU92637.1 hypothetical protein CK503_15715 [Aliifodinibius salipaludis]
MDFIGGLLVDLSLLGGILLFIMSLFKKYREYRYKMIILGLVLIVIWWVFIDTASLQEAFQQGKEVAQGI